MRNIYEVLKDCQKIVEAYAITNEDVLVQEENCRIRTLRDDLAHYVAPAKEAKQTPNVYSEIHTTYVREEDITLVWQDMYLKFDGHIDCIQHALVGWYCGGPTEDFTEHYASMPLIGQYID